MKGINVKHTVLGGNASPFDETPIRARMLGGVMRRVETNLAAEAEAGHNAPIIVAFDDGDESPLCANFYTSLYEAALHEGEYEVDKDMHEVLAKAMASRQSTDGFFAVQARHRGQCVFTPVIDRATRRIYPCASAMAKAYGKSYVRRDRYISTEVSISWSQRMGAPGAPGMPPEWMTCDQALKALDEAGGRVKYGEFMQSVRSTAWRMQVKSLREQGLVRLHSRSGSLVSL